MSGWLETGYERGAELLSPRYTQDLEPHSPRDLDCEESAVVIYDLLVIGGGINGVGIARDAAGRGLSVMLCEKDDLAAHTSSASTKLIHGGLRYLEHYEFSLVRKALCEREVLLRMAPHIIWPMRFVLPTNTGMRPSWLIRLGLFLYDHMGGRELLPATTTLSRMRSPELSPLKAKFKKAFEYSDCWVDDARLVVLNAVAAAEDGAEVHTRAECVGLKQAHDHWSAAIDFNGSGRREVFARAVVNAAGPWVDDIVNMSGDARNETKVRLVKGSHIIVPQLFPGDKAYFFQSNDGRIAFVIPYENNQFTLIGTTDETFEGNRNCVEASESEVRYLCDITNSYFEKQIVPEDVISTYSGVRPLFDDQESDASLVTRDYVLSLSDGPRAPILSVFGGKITTYRKLAEDALEQLSPWFKSMNRAWTEGAHLPGGEIENADFAAFFDAMALQYHWLDMKVLKRLLRAYGTRIGNVLDRAETVEDLGQHYGAGLYQTEVDYLIKTEFARTADDILWRRSKIGLRMTASEVSELETHLASREYNLNRPSDCRRPFCLS